jgi:hypothetical protein
MARTAPPPLALQPSTALFPSDYLYRMSLEKYEQLIESGYFTEYDRFLLVEGLLVAKMTQHPPHVTSAELCDLALRKILPVGWHLRNDRPLRIPARESMPEPDLVIARGEIRDYSRRHPEPPDVALVVEVSDSSLDKDRTLMFRTYGGGEVTRYWIVNLIDRQVEVYSSPSGSSEPVGYRHCEVFLPGQDVPLLIGEAEVGRIPVVDLLP